MNRIIAGKYIERESPIHRLDPRTKAVGLFAFVAYILIWPELAGHIFALLILLAVTRVSKIEMRMAGRFIWGARFFFYMAFLAHLLFTPGNDGFSWRIFSITSEGAANGLLFGLRLICLLWAAALFSWTTSPVELADGFRKTFSPLGKVGVNVNDMATMLLLALRFVPTLIQDARELKYAQEARGAKFHSGGIIGKIKSVVPLIIPLFAGAFRRADATAVALIVRGYEIEGERTSMHPLFFRPVDWGGILIACSLIFAGIGGRMFWS